MTKPSEATAVDAMNPRVLGVTHCTSCGQPQSVVGPLDLRPDDQGTCSYCGHDLDRYELLADELQNLMWPWVEACRERKVSERDIEEVIDIVEQRFLDHVAKAKGHYPSPDTAEA